MASDDSADVVVVGTGVVGCLIAQQALDAGLSVYVRDPDGNKIELYGKRTNAQSDDVADG